MHFSLATQKGNPVNHDLYVLTEVNTGGLACVLCDGAGSDIGSRYVIDAFKKISKNFEYNNIGAYKNFLIEVDYELSKQWIETTCIFLYVYENNILGISVGDSEAWKIDSEKHHILTSQQQRKPLLGSGKAVFETFKSDFKKGDVVLLGTDGLFKYTKSEYILKACRKKNFSQAPEELINLVRMQSGDVHDDTTCILITRAFKNNAEAPIVKK